MVLAWTKVTERLGALADSRRFNGILLVTQAQQQALQTGGEQLLRRQVVLPGERFRGAVGDRLRSCLGEAVQVLRAALADHHVDRNGDLAGNIQRRGAAVSAIGMQSDFPGRLAPECPVVSPATGAAPRPANPTASTWRFSP